MKFALGLLLGFVLGWLSLMIALKSEYLKPSPTVQATIIEQQRNIMANYQQRLGYLETHQAAPGVIPRQIPILTGCRFMRVIQPDLQCSTDQKEFRKVAEVRP